MSKSKPSFKKRIKRFWSTIKRRKSIIIPIVAIILTVLLVSVAWLKLSSGKSMPKVDDTNKHITTEKKEEKKSPLEGKICVCFGDSVTGNTEPPYDYPSIIAKETGMTVINLGFGGSRMSTHVYPEYEAFSMFRLADAIATNDYSVQEAYKDNKAIASVAETRLNSLYSIDWEKVDYITMLYGANDIKQSGNLLDNPENPIDTSSFLGAMRYSIERITMAYPNIKVVVLSPIYRYWDATGEYSDEQILQGIPYTAWVDSIITTANECNAFCIDLYHLTGFNSTNMSLYYKDDGIHPNHDGLEIIGKLVAREMIEHYSP